jgi:ATP/maltotriose-dependent transcriptional regulator MalT
MLIERYDSSARHLGRCISVSRHTGQGDMLGPATIDLAILHIWQGRLAEASALAEEALEIAHLSGSDQLLEWAQTTASWAALKRGDLREAIWAGEESVRLGRAVRRGAYTLGGVCWLADAMLEAGDPGGGRRVLLESIAAADLQTVDPGYRTVACDLLARTELALGNLDAASDWAQRGAAHAAAVGLARTESLALATRACVALAQRRPGLAAELALQAADRGASTHRVEAAQARIASSISVAPSATAIRLRVSFAERASRSVAVAGGAKPESGSNH